MTPARIPEAADKQTELRAAADRVFDESFFGRHKALDNELHGKKRWSKRPLEELRTELAEHEKKHATLLEVEAAKILATSP